MAKRRPLEIISGIGPDKSGTGQLMQFLLKAAKKSHREIRFTFGPPSRDEFRFIEKYFPERRAQWYADRKKSVDELLHLIPRILFGFSDLIVMHPQNLGFHFALIFLALKCFGKRQLFVLDNSFFCLKSYNHIEAEFHPCLRCVGGRFKSAQQNGCRQFPDNSRYVAWYLSGLRILVNLRRVELLVQNPAQAALARKHFWWPKVRVVGLKTEDTEFFEPAIDLPSPKQATVVFHGYQHSAKGFDWTVELARHLREVHFVFPFESDGKSYPSNCSFNPIFWATGLKELVQSADAVLVPSLWSAPVEGAVVKSVVYGKRVIAVKNESAFVSEIPVDVVAQVSSDPRSAAEEVREHLKRPATRGSLQHKKWIQGFLESRERFLVLLGFEV